MIEMLLFHHVTNSAVQRADTSHAGALECSHEV